MLASDLVKAGFEVRVVLTDGAAHFVTPLTFEALTGQPVARDIWEEQPGSSRMGHIELARWAQLLVVAPASAHSIASLSLGLAGDLLGAIALACPAPLLIAPAMESAMFGHPATSGHLRVLESRGARIVGPESGRLASGAHGMGRMSEPANILAAIKSALHRPSDLDGRRVLVTAGPTYEAIDRVRFVGNRSSGKMGYAVAGEAARRGAEVTLVSGPTALADPAGVRVIRIETAVQMRDAVMAALQHVDVTVMAAAVADFRPAEHVDGKVRRKEGMTLSLVPTSDIAAEAAAAAPHAFHVGFALEPEDAVPAALAKLKRKGQHLVVANEISDSHNPFGSDSNHVFFVTREGVKELPPLPKEQVARLLWDEVSERLGKC